MIDDLRVAACDVLRPLDMLTPGEFAERHRVVVGGPFAGRWDNSNGPFLTPVMDAVMEAIDTGKHLVCIKGAQEGVTEALGVNCVAWLLTFYGGPILYLTSKDNVAVELVHDRWKNVLETCEPLRKKHLAGKANNEKILCKRFTDGKLMLAGSKSLLNFLSNPFAVIVFDELDSCQEEMSDGSDPIALVMERLTAYAEGRPVVVIAFAHPTTKERGAAKLYYKDSDQRRGHVQCAHCREWFAPLWKHAQPLPRAGQSPASAERDPSCYAFVTPCCGVQLTDADRLKMILRVEQRSTLMPEVARTKKWIGLHVWHFFLRNGGAVDKLAEKFIAGLDDEGNAVVFRNKCCGDALEVEEEENPDEDAWRACVTLPRFDGDKASFYRGSIPDEVSVLTAGTDHNKDELHWAIWGWGHLPALGGGRLRCGWLIDWGVVPREPPEKTLDAADLNPFDHVVYGRGWRRPDGRVLSVVMAGHDSGWLPDGVYAFADKHAGRGVPVRGGADDEFSANPILRWGRKPKRFVKSVEVPWRDDRLAVVNTHLAKKVFFALVRRRFAFAREGAELERDRWRLHLPVDVDQDMINHLSSEQLVKSRKKRIWKRDPAKPNHWGDCAIYAFALSEQVASVQRDRTAREDARRVVEREAKKPMDEDEGKERRRWTIGRDPR